MDGGAGDDDLTGGPGADTYNVTFSNLGEGDDTITGFSGAGHAGGDVLNIGVDVDTVTHSGGQTVFTYEDGGSITVDAVGLVENQDYFFV
jgi:Ca2+-binding RTX toxin-like protein